MKVSANFFHIFFKTDDDMVVHAFGCSTWEDEPCSSPRQHSRSGASGMDAGELALWTSEQDYWSLS